MKDRNIDVGDNWKTPDDLYKKLDAEFHFDFDPCPYSEDLYIPPERNGLVIDWGMCNYVNPPYKGKILVKYKNGLERKERLKDLFVRRAVIMKGRGKTSVCLLPVSTSTKLFHRVILPNADEIRWLEGRVKFAGYDTKGNWVDNRCGTFDSMLVIFRGVKK